MGGSSGNHDHHVRGIPGDDTVVTGLAFAEPQVQEERGSYSRRRARRGRPCHPLPGFGPCASHHRQRDAYASEGDRGRRRFSKGCLTIIVGMASFGVGTKGSVTISSLVSWAFLVTGAGSARGTILVTGAGRGRNTRGVEVLALGDLPARYSAAALSKRLTDGWAVVLVLDVVRVGADEVKTTGCVVPPPVAGSPLDCLAARGAAPIGGRKTRGWSVGWAVGWVKVLDLARVVVASSARSAALVIVGWVVVAFVQMEQSLERLGWRGLGLDLRRGGRVLPHVDGRDRHVRHHAACVGVTDTPCRYGPRGAVKDRHGRRAP